MQEKQPPPTNSAVNQLQTYLLGKSYIKVFSLEDAAHGSKDKDSVRPAAACKRGLHAHAQRSLTRMRP